MDLAQIESGFVTRGMPRELASVVLAEYVATKRRFHLGDHGTAAIDGGRFVEAVMRVVEHAVTGSYRPLGKSGSMLTTLRLQQLESSAVGVAPESLRIHVPRALFAVYTIRNKRNTAHLQDGIDPNLQDSTLIVGTLDWVMAELVRVYHDISPTDAQEIIHDLVTREVPVVEEIDGQPVCSKKLGVGDLALVFLYRAGRDQGLSPAELQRQMRHSNRSNMMRAIRVLDQKGLVLIHPVTGRLHITSAGLADVEGRRLLEPISRLVSAVAERLPA